MNKETLQKAAERLGQWLEDRCARIKWLGTENPPNSLLELNKARYSTGCLLVDTRFTEDNLFNDAYKQVLFRVWHEWIHWNYQLQFDMHSEVEAAFRHVAELPEDWVVERHIVMAEVMGHVAHYYKFGNFVDSRTDFAVKLLSTGNIAPHYHR